MTYNNKNTKELNEFQIKKIKNRLSLNFYQELDKLDIDKERYSNIFSNQIDVLIRKFDKQGIMFYGIDIELPFLLQNSDSNFWEEVHKNVEEFINYIGSHIELVEFSYFSIEMKGRKPIWQGGIENKTEKNSFPCIKGIIAVRSLVGKNESLFLEIKDLFIISFFDIKLKWLSNYSEIHKYWHFVIKEKNFKFHRFVNYSNFYPLLYGSIADEELKFEGRTAFGQENHFISDTMNINGIMKKFPKRRDIVLFFLKLFMLNNNIIIYDNKIFSKISESRISWRIIYTLDDMRKDFVNIIDSLKLMYPQQLRDFSSSDLVLSDLDLVFSRIEKDNNLLFSIDFFDNVIEFNDGIFFFEIGIFSSFEDEKLLNLHKLKTLFYFNINYSDLNSADFWLNFIYKNLDEVNFKNLLKKLK